MYATLLLIYILLPLFVLFIFINFLLAGWESASERRNFFENYAKRLEFDPLTPDNWYIQPKERIMSTEVLTMIFFFFFLFVLFFFASLLIVIMKGAFQVIHYHNDSISAALLDLFPDIGLTKVGFLAQCKLLLTLLIILSSYKDINSPSAAVAI